MPDRIIRDRARSSRSLQLLSDAAERAWWRLTVAADDYGCFDADPEVLLSRLFERKPKGWTVTKMREVRDELASGDDPVIHLYQVENDPRIYGHIVSFRRHQRSRESKPKFPSPPCKKAPPNATSPQLAAICGKLRLARAPASGVVSRESRVESREAEVCSEQPSTIAGDGAPAPPPQHPGNGNSLDPVLKAILDECPNLSLVNVSESAGFWDQVLAACEPYGVADAAWLGARLRKWNQYFAARPHKRSRERKYLESRLLGWLTKDLEAMARRPA